MDEGFAKRYAAALLKGNEGKSAFEVTTPESMDLDMVAKALEDYGCRIVRGEFANFLTVHVPDGVHADLHAV